MASASRRAALCGLALAPLASLPALAAPNPDAAVLALAARWQAGEAVFEAASRLCAERHDATRLPPHPAALRVREGDDAFGIVGYASCRDPKWYSVEGPDAKRRLFRRRFLREEVRPATRGERGPLGGEIVKRVPWPEAQARADEIVAAWDEWQAACDAAYVASGYTAARVEADRLMMAQGELEGELQASVPRTLAGLTAVAEFARRIQTDSDDEGALGGFLARSILAVAGVQAEASPCA